MTQLDLFKQPARKTGQVVAFPADRRAALIRATAHELCTLDYIAGRKFWSEHVKGCEPSFALSASPLAKSIWKSVDTPQPLPALSTIPCPIMERRHQRQPEAPHPHSFRFADGYAPSWR
ncbi:MULTISPECIES: DUF6074 family protein [unclassified Mesorhizobium]|uniref:DUF6074 family protein n=1 Tax=unclassified Mesorhizobium TaxID=325217 RepID=UPI0003CDE343|nr:DUF6074 family protein [Mesorhizobium sp. LNJC384A00]ESY41978.1 hypothetical protein X747_14100 [Mesorhizobium sp. LNJC384A00]